MKPKYDTVEGIQEYLTDLEGLNRLIEDRREAGYSRGERLEEFLVMGHWMTDSRGNFGRCEINRNHKPWRRPNGLARAVSVGDLLKVVPGLSLSMSFGNRMPLSRVKCRECGNRWTIENAHDAQVVQEGMLVPLVPGRTVAEREKDWSESADGWWTFGSDPSVRNLKFVDMSPHPEYEGQAVNDVGWRHRHPALKEERLTREYVAEEGDEAAVTVLRWEHGRCAKDRRAREAREFFEGVFRDAGVAAELQQVPNEYCSCDACGPWFVAKTTFGDVKIGWRKRVINIDWSATGTDFSALFASENVTKWAGGIHAWGKDAAVRYLKAVRVRALT